MRDKIIFTGLIVALLAAALGMVLGLDISKWWPIVAVPGSVMVVTMLVDVWKEPS